MGQKTEPRKRSDGGRAFVPVNVPPSEQNLRILEAVRVGVRDRASVGLIARAGSGKTTMLRMIAEAEPDLPTALFCFNTANADEAKRVFPPWVRPATFHSVAMSAVGQYYRQRLVTDTWALVAPYREVVLRVIGQKRRAAATAYTNAVIDGLARFYASDAPQPEAIALPPAPDLDEDLVRAGVHELWGLIIDKAESVPLVHDAYLKIYAETAPPLAGIKRVMVDEYQDLTPAQRKIVEKHTQQKIVVGDPYQQLYAFRGAVDAFDGFQGERYPLTESWRFGPAIAGYANRFLRALGAEDMIVGKGDPSGAVVEGARDVDAVLARTNVGLIGEALAAARAGRKLHVVGGTKQITGMMLGAYALSKGEQPQHPAYRSIPSWEDLVLTSRSEQGHAFAPIVALVKLYADELPRLCQMVNEAQVQRKEADVVLCSGHKAKGDQWGIVRVSGDFAPWVGDDGVIARDEVHLAYVVATRAQRVLDVGPVAAQWEASFTAAGVPRTVSGRPKPTAAETARSAREAYEVLLTRPAPAAPTQSQASSNAEPASDLDPLLDHREEGPRSAAARCPEPADGAGPGPVGDASLEALRALTEPRRRRSDYAPRRLFIPTVMPRTSAWGPFIREVGAQTVMLWRRAAMAAATTCARCTVPLAEFGERPIIRERFSFTEAEGHQIFEGAEVVCAACGVFDDLLFRQSNRAAAIARLALLNGYAPSRALRDLGKAIELAERRSLTSWTLSLFRPIGKGLTGRHVS